jgi:predicted extracellular nuclease
VSFCKSCAGWGLAALLLVSAACTQAVARESCTFKRDPAYWAKTPVSAARSGEISFATQNLYRYFDDENDRGERDVLTPAQFAARTQRLARYIARDLGAPAVLALQEIEDDTALAALAAAVGRETGRPYRALMGEVSGGSDIRNALLFDARLRVRPQASLFARTPRAGKPLHDRLPLVADIDTGSGATVTVVVVHMKSLRGIGKGGDGRVADKRRYQAKELAAWTRAQVAKGRRLIVLGDFNATAVDSDATRAEPLQILMRDGALDDPAAQFLKPTQRWTYVYGCELNELDHVLVSPALLPAVSGYAIARGDSCIRAKEKCSPERSVSDHDGVVLKLRNP